MKWQEIKNWIIATTLIFISLGSVILIVDSGSFSIMLNDGTMKAKYSEGNLKVYSGRNIAFEDYINIYYWNGEGYTTMYKARGEKYSNLSYYKENDTTFVKQLIQYSRGNLTRYFEITEYNIKESFEWQPNEESLRVYFLWTYDELDEYAEKQVYFDKNTKMNDTVMDFNIINNWEKEIDNIVRVERFQNGRLKIRTRVFEGDAQFDPDIILKDIKKRIRYTETTKTTCLYEEWTEEWCGDVCLNPEFNETIGEEICLNGIEYQCRNSIFRENMTCKLEQYSVPKFGFEDDKWKDIDKLRSFKDTIGIDCNVNEDDTYGVECIDYNSTHLILDLSIKKDEKLDKDIPLKKFYKIKEDEEIKIKETILDDKIKLKDKEETQRVVIPINVTDIIHFGENSTTIQIDYTDVIADIEISGSGGMIHGQWRWDISSIPSGVTIDGAILGLYDTDQSITVVSTINAERIVDQTWTESITAANAFAQTTANRTTSVTLSGTQSDDNWRWLSILPQLKTSYDLSETYCSVRLDQGTTAAYFSTTDDGEIKVGSSTIYNTFHSREAGSNEPYLNVTYTIIGTEVTDCAVLNESDEYYYMSGDLTDKTVSYCIDITADNVTFDCQGYTLDGNDAADAGIRVQTQTNISIINCDVTDWDTYGIYLINAYESNMENTNTSSNPDIGISFYNSNGIILKDVMIENNLDFDISLVATSTSFCNYEFDNVIGSYDKPILFYNTSVTIENWNNNFSQLLLCNADNSVINNITFDSVTDKNGIILTGNTEYSIISDSIFLDCEYCVYLYEADDNNITNISTTTSFYGIYLRNSENNIISDSISTGNQYGLHLQYSDYNVINGGNYSNNGQRGIGTFSLDYSNFTNVTVGSNGVLGIYLDGTNNNIKHSNIESHSGSEDIGIHIDDDNNNIFNTSIIDNYYGIRLDASADNNNISHNIIQENTYGISEYSSASITPNIIYDNLLNQTINVRFLDAGATQYWNISNITGTRIITGGNLGGNYWTNSSATGYSDTCTDVESDGFCDSPWDIETNSSTCTSNNCDYFPYSDEKAPPQPPTTPTSLTCNSGSCNNTFTSTISMECSGSTDPESDVITYVIEKGNYTASSCGGTASACSTHSSNATCQYDAGCDWNGTGESTEEIDYEGFTTNFGSWVQATFDTDDWLRKTSAPADSSGTGPNGLYDGPYIIVETSGGQCNSPDTAVVYLSPAIDFDSYTEINISFVYNMIGSTMGTLHVKENSTGSWVSVWSRTGDQGSSWLTANQNITATGEGNVAIWMDCGASYTSDAAVDSVNVTGTSGADAECVGTPAACSTYNSNQTSCDGTDCDWTASSTDYTVVGNHTTSPYSWDISGETFGEIYENMRCRAIDLLGSITYSSYFTIDTLLELEPGAGDTCTCPGGTTAHEFDCSDSCDVSTCTAGAVTFTGSGTVRCGGIWNIGSLGDPGNSCILYIDSACDINE